MSALNLRRLGAEFTRLRCVVFQTAYNPTSQRTGAKYLRARLRGPSMMNYYPELNKAATMRFARKLAWEMDIPDPLEEQRLEDIEERKRRGKGPPKKAKGPPEAKKGVKKKKTR